MSVDYLAILRRYWGYDSFRPLQRQAIESVGAGQDTLVLMPTGGGKSIVFQVPALAVEGVCIVVTPLVSLMKDQVDQLRRRHILAEALHSGLSRRDIDRILDNCIYGDVKFLYLSPERIDSELFRIRFARMRVSLLTVDEAHCISQWGYDFRPSYLNIARLREIHPEVPILALTASATPKVCRDIMSRLEFHAPHLLRMSFARYNLCYLVRHTEDKREHLLRILNNVPGSGIVYVRTREKTDTLADFLRENKISADSYHGGMDFRTRTLKQEQWTRGQTRIMVATNAFGMGIDKPDVRTVVHYDPCDSLESYYQEAGRAGRDGTRSYAVLLLSQEDASRCEQRLSLEFPPVETIRRLYEGIFNYLQIAIGDGKGQAWSINLYDLSARLKVFTPTLINALKILQQNGYLIFTDEVDNPPRVRFIVHRDELYRIRVERKELDHLITVLLRQYSGLFSDFRPIDENELAHLSGYTTEHVRELLQKLWQLHLIKYIPGNRSPMLILSEERLPTADLRISPESYTLRKESARKRLEQMLQYGENQTGCRSVFIQRYFGEENPDDCGLCDICRQRRKERHTHPVSPHQALDVLILKQLEARPTDLKTLTAEICGEIDIVLSRITLLLESGKISEQKDGKLRINR